MGIEAGRTGSITVADGELIISQGQAVKALYILTSGRVEIIRTASGVDVTADEEVILTEGYRLGHLGQNSFPGIAHLFDGKVASCSYRAVGPCTLYLAPIQNEQQLQSIMASKPDHAVAMAMTMMMTIDAVFQAWGRLQRVHDPLSVMVENAGVYLFLLREIIGSKITPRSQFFRQSEQNLGALRLRDIPIPEDFSQPFMEKDFSAIYGEERLSPPQSSKKQIEYYRRFARLAPNLRKAFFTADPAMTLYQCHDLAKCLGQLLDDVGSLVDRYDELFSDVYDLHKESLFTEYARAALDAIRTNSDSVLPSQVIDYLAIRTREILGSFSDEFGKDPGIDFGYFERALQQDDINAVAEGVETSGLSPDIAALLDDDAAGSDSDDIAIIPDESPAVEEVVDLSSLPDEVKGSLKRILDYSGIPKEKADQFKAAIEAFRKLKDKFSSEDPVRKLRRVATAHFFDIYEAVFKRMHKERNKSRLFEMFINFGFMDERLLEPATTMRLYKLLDRSPFNPEYPVYTMTEWLAAVYSREKEPSIDDFGNDYMGVFRELKKRGEVGEADKENYENNVDKRLHHEVSFMVKTTQRLCYGQLSVHFPVLHQDMFVKEMENALVAKKKVEDELRKLLKVDFSAFYREVMLRKPDAGIEREFVQMPVIPDIILAPTYGSRQFMWQELVGKDKRSRARIILPILISEDLEGLIVDAVGAFRWELCKTMLGPAWNDVTQPSITADYTDYIQFYRKNRDLSEETKAKIKTQIQNCRGNMRDIFVSDYRFWIKYESQGVIRLNKVVRNILYRHCPFSRELRDQLEKQPMFTEIAVRFKNIRSKKITEITNHYHKYTKNGGDLDPELEANRRFYAEL